MAAVVFDFDGVIADSEPLHFSAFREAFDARGWTLDRAAYYDRYLGYGDADLLTHFARDTGLTLEAAQFDALLREKEAAFLSRLVAGPPLVDGAASCIERLAAVFPLAIASGALANEIERVLAHHDLRRHFRAIVAIDDVRRGKPAPDPYLQAAAALGSTPRDCVAIEDSPGGIASAVAAGLRVVAVPTSCAADDLAGAHLIAPSLEAITPDVIRAQLAAPNRV